MFPFDEAQKSIDSNVPHHSDEPYQLRHRNKQEKLREAQELILAAVHETLDKTDTTVVLESHMIVLLIVAYCCALGSGLFVELRSVFF